MLNVYLDANFILIYFQIDSFSTMMTVILTMTLMIVRMNSTVTLICTMMNVMTMTMMIGRMMTGMIQILEKDLNILYTYCIAFCILLWCALCNLFHQT